MLLTLTPEAAVLRRAKMNHLLLFLIAAIASTTAFTLRDIGKEDEHVHYDQRQNGTENYRVNIDGVLLAVAPAEPFLNAVASSDISEILELLELNETDIAAFGEQKPSTTTQKTDEAVKPSEVPKAVSEKATKKS